MLADVFDTFRNTCLEHYKLDSAHFLTTAILALQALLETASEYHEHETNCKDLWLDGFSLELLRDIDKLLMLKKGIRGVITETVKRFAKANDKHMKDQ